MMTNSYDVSEVVTKVEGWLSNPLYFRHTPFQEQQFIVGKEPTYFGSFLQSIRELRARVENIQKIKADLECARIDYEIAQIQVSDLEKRMADRTDELELKKANIQLKEQARKIKNLEVQLNCLLAEFDRFYQLAVYYEQQMREQMATENKSMADLEREYWEARFTNMACVKMMSRLSGIDGSVLESILSLPEESAKSVLRNISNEFARMANNTQQSVDGLVYAKPDVLNVLENQSPKFLLTEEAAKAKFIHAIEDLSIDN